MIIVECYFDKILFSEIFGKNKIGHVYGKMKALRKLRKNNIYILDYDPNKPTEDLPNNLKKKFKLNVAYEDDKIKIYKSSKLNIIIVLLKPYIEGFFRKFGGKLDIDTHIRNEKILRKIIENNKEVIDKIKNYFERIK